MTELDLVRAAAPAPPAPSPAVEAAARGALVAAMDAESPPYPTVARLRRRPLRRLGPSLVAVAAAAAVVTAAPVADVGGGAPPAASAEAQTFLLAAARSAEKSQHPDARDASYWYVSSTTSGAQATTGSREIWLGRATAGTVVINGETRPLDGPARFSNGVTWDELFDLPTETGELRERIYGIAGDAGSDRHSEAFVVIGDLLRESPAPPALRAALLRVAATIPGVELGGRMTDDRGRATTTVVRADADGATQTRLWLHPDDGALLQEDVVALRDLRVPERPASQSIRKGTTLFRSTLIASGPAASAGSRPPAQ